MNLAEAIRELHRRETHAKRQFDLCIQAGDERNAREWERTIQSIRREWDQLEADLIRKGAPR